MIVKPNSFQCPKFWTEEHLLNYSKTVRIENLDCKGCIRLMEIPNIVGLKKLSITLCPILLNIYPIVGLETLFVKDCPLLKSSPSISSLHTSTFSGCQSLEIINGSKIGLRVTNCEKIKDSFNVGKIETIANIMASIPELILD